MLATAESGVATATIALACVTLLLAFAAGWQAWLSRRALQAGLRPLLVDLPVGIFVQDQQIGENVHMHSDEGEVDLWPEDNGSLQIRIPLRNAGAGIALIVSLTLGWDSGGDWRAAARHTAIPSGETTYVDAVVAFPDRNAALAAMDGLQPDQLSIEVGYTDINAKQRGRTRAWVMKHPDPDSHLDYIVDRIELFKGRKLRPFASLSGRREEQRPAVH